MTQEGIVTKSTGSWYQVKTSEETFSCRIKGNLRIQDIKSTNPVAVGDRVMVDVNPDNTGVIIEVMDRKNYIIRKSSNLSKQSHIIAANLDLAILVVTHYFPHTPREFIDRYLVTAEAYHIQALLVFNKIDLLTNELEEEMEESIRLYEKIGYTCLRISVKDKTHLDQLQAMVHNKVSLVSGYSGVGKSSLINALIPGLSLKTGDISSYHLKGKHTTSFAEMVELPQGGFIIDTPGIRGFGLVHIEKDELGLYFPEIFSTSKDCQYNNCTHTHEPGCAVKKAVDEQLIHPSRYRSYLNIFEDTDSKYRM